MPAICVEEEPQHFESMTELGRYSEDTLQRILAQHPDLQAGESNGTTSQKYVLVRREAGAPATEGGAGQFSLDHLILDRAGIPTFVELQRSKSTQIRRGIVGQLLNYAANGVLHLGRGMDADA